MKIRKTILLILVVILSTSVVIASEPTFRYENRLKDEVKNGENNIGDLLFFHDGYSPQIHDISEIEDIEIQRFDRIKWLGTDPIIITQGQTQTTITTGETHDFNVTGNFTFSDVDGVNTGTIDITPADSLFIDIEEVSVPTGFDLVFSDTNFPLSTNKLVNFTLVVDNNVKKGDYNFRYKINDEEKTHDFKVLENLNWSMNTTNITNDKELKSGESFYLGRIEVTNTGNDDMQLVVTKSGSGQNFVSTPQPQPLRVLNSVFVDLQVQIPTVQRTGEYDIKINLTAGGLSETIDFNITVIDNIPPVVESVNFSTDRVFVPNDINVVATDNVEVDRVIMKFDNKTIEMVKDGNLFTHQETFTKLSEYKIEFCAYDEVNNTGCKTINKTFVEINAIENFSSSYNLPAKRFGLFSKVELFNITERVPDGVKVSLVDLTTNRAGNQSIIVRIVDDKGSVRQVSRFETISIFEKGEYYLEVRADEEIDVEGILRFELPQQFNQVPDATFRASFKSYDVPNDFVVEWVEGRELNCKVYDTGDLATSYYDCNIHYPVSVKPNDLSIPTTVDERQKFQKEVEEKEDELNSSRRRNAWIITLLLAFLVMSTLIGLFMIYWYPYINMQTGSTKSYKGDRNQK